MGPGRTEPDSGRRGADSCRTFHGSTRPAGRPRRAKRPEQPPHHRRDESLRAWPSTVNADTDTTAPGPPAVAHSSITEPGALLGSRRQQPESMSLNMSRDLGRVSSRCRPGRAQARATVGSNQCPPEAPSVLLRFAVVCHSFTPWGAAAQRLRSATTAQDLAFNGGGASGVRSSGGGRNGRPRLDHAPSPR
jgi:hypothetical protein